MTHPRLSHAARTLAVTVGAAIASVLVLTVSPTGASATAAQPASAGPTRPATTQQYAIPKADCGDPAPGHVACLSFHLRRVARGTPGAKAFTAPAAGRGMAGGYTPADLASAYGYTPSSSVGASQTVAIVDAYDDPSARTELDAFDKHYGLPAETATSFRKVNQSGNASPLPAFDQGWSGEIALDIEAVRAVCNKCHIILVEATSTDDTSLAAGVNSAARLGATEISNSYGGPETVSGRTTSSATTLAAYNHPGIVITASTGDHGWDDWDLANDGAKGWSDNAPNAPASYPTVVAVGGTKLTLTSSGARQSETVWNENGTVDSRGLVRGKWKGDQGASGGGCSTLYQAPSFQAGVSGYAALGCGSGLRSTGDVAALADPYTGFDVYDSVNFPSSPWVTTGGTSLSSPLIAAMWALAGGSGTVAYPAQNLYEHFKTTPSSLYDVASGGNGFCGGVPTSQCSTTLSSELPTSAGNPNNITNGNTHYVLGWAGLLDCAYSSKLSVVTQVSECNAGTGYDGPSGVGAPRGLTAFRRTGPTVTMTWPALVKRNVTTTYRGRFSDSVVGATATSYRWTWGDGTAATTTTTPTARHRFTKRGRFTVSVRVVDSAGRTSPAATRRYAVGYAPTAKVSGPTNVKKGKSGRYAAKATDANTGGKITGYTWRVGTKTVGHARTLSHRFATRGAYKVTVTVRDNSGLSTRSKAATVRVK